MSPSPVAANEERSREGSQLLLLNGLLTEARTERPSDRMEEGVAEGGSVEWVERWGDAGDGAETSSIYLRQGLPKDITARELAALFFFSKGYLESRIIVGQQPGGEPTTEVTAIVRFESPAAAMMAKDFLNGKILEASNSPLMVEMLTVRGVKRTPSSSSVSSLVHKNYPSATLSSSSKSSGSSISLHPQTSRFAHYCSNSNTLKNNDLMSTFYSVTNTSPLLPVDSTTENMWSPASPGFSYASLGSFPPVHKNTLINESADEWRFQPAVSPAVNYATANGSPSQPSISRFANTLASNVQHLSPNGVLYTGSNTISPNRHKSAVQDHRLANNNSTTMPSVTTPSNGHTSSTMSPQTNHFVPNSFTNSPKIQSNVVGLNNLQITNPANHPYFINSSYGYGYANHFRGPISFSTNPADQNPPCNTLYVGNLPLSTSEDELKSLFSRQPGYRRLCYRTKSNGPMCFVEFEDVGYAMKALGLLQGVCLSSSVKGGIRLSFSKNPLGVRSSANPNMLMNHYGVHNNGFSPSIHTHSGFAVPSSSWTGMNQQLLGK